MTTEELLAAAQGMPWLVSGIVILTAVSYGAEKLTGLAGPLTKATAHWNSRQLRKLRRAAVLRAEARRIEQEEEGARLSALRVEVEWLRDEVARLIATHRCTCTDTAPMRAARNTPRVPEPRR